MIHRKCDYKKNATPSIAIFLLSLTYSLAGFADGVFAKKLVAAALERTHHAVQYDGRYFKIPYPNGDVPSHIGVCTDLVIRAYRRLGVDLQSLVHEDVAANFDVYPSRRIWGLQQPDPNIDHRRVPNLQVFFARHGMTLSITGKPSDYHPGDLVTWSLPGNLPHIGIVSDTVEPGTGVPFIVHNIGRGPVLENMLFKYQVTGHYRFERFEQLEQH